MQKIDYKDSRIKILEDMRDLSQLTNMIYLKGNLTTDPFYKIFGEKEDAHMVKFMITVSEMKMNNKTGGSYFKKDSFSATFFGKEYYWYAWNNGAVAGVKIELLGVFSLDKKKLKNGLIRHYANIKGIELRVDEDEKVIVPKLVVIEESEIASDLDADEPEAIEIEEASDVNEDKKAEFIKRFKKNLNK